MNLIDTSKLHPELIVYQKEQETFKAFSRDEFINSVQHWKNILGESINFKPGSKVGIGIELLNIRYASLLYAVSELGGINLVLDKVPVGSDKLPRCRVLAPFDLYVFSETPDQRTKNIGLWYSKNQLSADVWYDYQTKQNNFYATQLVPAEDDLFMQSPSSGSTGTPKVIGYTHKWLTKLSHHCAQTLNFRSNDRVLHLTNLHHGGSSGVFFFPTMNFCREHYFDHGLDTSERRQKQIVNLIVQQQINKVMFPNSILLDQILKLMPPIEHDCCFYSLQANHKAWVAESRRTGIQIVSLFGASETLGPIFINKIDATTADNHNVLNYGKPLSSFYSVEIRGRRLQVTDITGLSNTLNDVFTVDQKGDHYYNSRSDLIRINEVILEFSDLQNILLANFDELSAALLADTTANKIYLLLSDSLKDSINTTNNIEKINQALAAINPVLKIDFIDYVNFEDYLTGIKLDRAASIDHFRKKFNLI
jgi:acyl-CoA synthetase (AMP-forming)/AMP-acid ligase II